MVSVRKTRTLYPDVDSNLTFDLGSSDSEINLGPLENDSTASMEGIPMWKFRELGANQSRKDPKQEREYLDRRPANAVVRETIQNSLDASVSPDQMVIVKFRLGHDSVDLNHEYFKALTPHLAACNVTPNQGLFGMHHLVIEDFGTTGLEGGVSAEQLNMDEFDSFIGFWFQEGSSGKIGGRQGRHGVGKTTLNYASQIRTIFGMSMSFSGNEPLRLMGKIRLKDHTVDGVMRSGEGFYSGGNDSLYLPIESPEAIEKFKSTFSLEREKEPGLSLVIPSPVDEIDGTSILKAVIQNWYYAILSGRLEVALVQHDQNTHIDRNGVIDIALNQDWIGTDWSTSDIKGHMDFALSIITAPERETYTLDMTTDQHKITDISFGDSLNSIRKVFQHGETVSVKVPVEVRYKDSSKNQASFFIVSFAKYNSPEAGSNDPLQELYVRGGIVLRDMPSTLGSHKVRVILTVDDDSLSSLMGDSENTHHTRWIQTAPALSDPGKGYESIAHAQAVVRMVNNSVRQILDVIDVLDDERLPGFMGDILYVPDRPKRQNTRIPDEEDVLGPGEVPDIDSSSIDYFNISKAAEDDGVLVTLSSLGKKYLPFTAVVSMAYALADGTNPFKAYRPEDFTINGDLSWTETGLEVLEVTDNSIRFSVRDENARLVVTGFDGNRDITIDHRRIGE
tara:strand:- start:5984 stop:8014 length:2031 start_codon:yes stop_codon:yes gene_type:complete